MTGRTRVVINRVRRLEIAVDLPFEEFRQRYEQAVPSFDPSHFGDLDPDRTDWATIRRITAQQAPHDFLLYWRGETDLMMRVAGHATRCTAYLMGNHTIAERMYRHNPGVMLYAPLRTTIYEDHDDRLWFSVDQPSTRFSSFDDPEITEVGVYLDGKLADLFTTLGLVVPAGLTRWTGIGDRRQLS
ncbi:DUF302 domain-containing protein [Streptomyces sp. ME02-8801-2C]|uniref:DUF302 domain-containing protein n=1 Tax=Streptomyces sp. ME02-8801-2C TaxID=3028680 RepID=UPI0029BD3703|nr:DUF302 domain-containing protein [Streptomyces sp. ME02-8801-2C]MDX3457125.1 DUF302 domain-containing protein [Streptomyces sp. ME02-8801-2C]